MLETRQIQIRFTEKTDVGEYSDALYFPLDAYNNGEITEEIISAEKSSRVFNWSENIKNPPEMLIMEQSPEEIQAQIDALEQQAILIEQQKSELLDVKLQVVEAIAVRERIALEEFSLQALLESGGQEEIIL